MKKLVYSSATTPVFNVNQGQVQKLSQNINIYFNNRDKLSCNNLAKKLSQKIKIHFNNLETLSCNDFPNFDPKSPSDHTTSNPHLLEIDSIVQHDSKMKNTIDGC